MEDWQKARLEVTTRARSVQNHLLAQRAKPDLYPLFQTLQKNAAAITSLDYENTAMLRVYTDLLYEHMYPAKMRERLGLTLVHGLVAMTQHAWLCVEGDVTKVNAGIDVENAQRLETAIHLSSAGVLRWRVIIDICALEIEPSILLIAPTSPLAPQYTEQTRYTVPVDYSKALDLIEKKNQMEGVAESDVESRILEALMNKHAR